MRISTFSVLFYIISLCCFLSSCTGAKKQPKEQKAADLYSKLEQLEAMQEYEDPRDQYLRITNARIRDQDSIALLNNFKLVRFVNCSPGWYGKDLKQMIDSLNSELFTEDITAGVFVLDECRIDLVNGKDIKTFNEPLTMADLRKEINSFFEIKRQ